MQIGTDCTECNKIDIFYIEVAFILIFRRNIENKRLVIVKSVRRLNKANSAFMQNLHYV